MKALFYMEITAYRILHYNRQLQNKPMELLKRNLVHLVVQAKLLIIQGHSHERMMCYLHIPTIAVVK